MKYKLREDVVFETICDQSLLVATLTAREQCPYIMHLNEDSAFFVRLVLKEKTIQEITESIIENYEVSEEEALEGAKAFISELMKNNYLLIKED
ncbi:MAG: PqqD family protein [Firmicutes bacterium]|nr:PqqD family protein [Bacillota bacterium]